MVKYESQLILPRGDAGDGARVEYSEVQTTPGTPGKYPRQKSHSVSVPATLPLHNR